VFNMLGQFGGFIASDINFRKMSAEDQNDYKECLTAGMAKCFGNEGHDLIIEYDKNAPAKEMYKVSISRHAGKVLEMEPEGAPNLDQVFIRVNKLDTPEGQAKPKAPGKAGKPTLEKKSKKPAAPKKKAKDIDLATMTKAQLFKVYGKEFELKASWTKDKMIKAMNS